MAAINNYIVFGATGRQGKAVLNELLSHPSTAVNPSQVYAVTRSADSESAKRLVNRHAGLHLLQGSTANAAELFAQLPEEVRHIAAIFLNLPDDPAKERVEGPAVIDAARNAGIPHVVYASVDRGLDSDNESSWVPQFQVKFETEKHLKAVAEASNGQLTYTILRPVFFMENFQWGFLGQVVATGVRDQLKGMKVQMVATRDIGRWAAEGLLFSQDPQLKNKAISLASDQLTFSEADAIFKRQTGQHIPTTFSFLSAFIIYMVGPVNKLFRWFHDRPAEVDIRALSRRLEPTTFEQWAATVAKKQV